MSTPDDDPEARYAEILRRIEGRKQNNNAPKQNDLAAILDGLNLNDEEQRLFIVYRNIEGHTKVKRIIKKPNIEGEPVKLSEAFLRGYLGGLNKI